MTEAAAQLGRVRQERHGRILKIVIDNPAKMNAFSPEMMEELSEAFTVLDRDDDLWAGVLCAEGKHFTAGLDMPKFFGPSAVKIDRPVGNIDPFGLANQCRKPIVTAIQGVCFTVGIEIMLAGDIVVAAEDARLCQMEAKRGIAPLGGAHFRFLTRAGWGAAMYHLFLCDEFNAAEAHRIGLVNAVFEPEELLGKALELAQSLAAKSPAALAFAKQATNLSLQGALADGLAQEATLFAALFATEDQSEGMSAFIEKRTPGFTGR